MRSTNHAKNILDANDSYFALNDNHLRNANDSYLNANENHLHIANQILIRMICICIANENHLQQLFKKFSRDLGSSTVKYSIGTENPGMYSGTVNPLIFVTGCVTLWDNEPPKEKLMRCKACDALLNEYESTRRSSNSGEFLDLCNYCYKSIEEDIEVFDNSQYIHFQDVVDFDENP